MNNNHNNNHYNNDNELIQDDNLQCGQITLTIPYRKITSIKFLNITLSEQNKHLGNQQNTYKITFECKYEELSKSQQPMVIERNLSHFQWLETALKLHTQGKFTILPILHKQSLTLGVWNYLTNKITHTSPTHHPDHNEKKTSRSFSETMIHRYLLILSGITMKSLYPKPNDTENPVFIFIQQEDTFNFYLPLYEQEKKKNQNTFKGYITGIWDYIPVFAKKKSVQAHGLETTHEQFTKLSNKTKQLHEKLTLNHSKLSTLSQNFIQKQHRIGIKHKLSVIQQLLQEMDFCLRYLQLVIDEIDENTQAYVGEGGEDNLGGGRKGDVGNSYKLIEEYVRFVTTERVQIQSKVADIARRFINLGVVETSARVRIQLRQTYDDYRLVQ